MIVALLSLLFTPTPLDQLLDKPELAGSLIGVHVCELDGTPLYSRNEKLRLMPASNQKINTVAYALWRLGPDYRPTTKFWKMADRIVVQSDGDPSMTYDDLVAIKKKLQAKDDIPVFVNQSYRPGFGPGWEWDDLPNRYAPAICAFSVDKGGFELWADPAKVWMKSSTFGIKLRRIDAEKTSWNFDFQNRIMTFRGPLPKSSAMLEAFAIPEPDRAAALTIGSYFLPTTDVPNGEPDYIHRGKPMSELAKLCLVPSDNFIAENLLFMAAQKEGPLGANPWDTAQKRMKSFLVKEVGLEPSEVDPYDGSGLSRHNNVTSSGIAKLLRWAKRQPTAALWMDSLAVPGSGTLRNRLKDSSFRGKTGTLNKVVSLSGYCKVKGGREVVVSIVFNHFLGDSAVARNTADEFVRKIESGNAFGTNLEVAFDHANRLPFPNDHASAWNWNSRHDRDRGLARSRSDRRNESADESVHRAK